MTNLMSFTGTADIPGFIPDYMGGEYWDVFDTWRTHSAMFNIKGVKTPTLIQHGEQDVRVPISQGYELYNALRRQGVDVQMVVYPRQPHGFTEPKMTLDAARANLDWFDRFVMNRPAPPTSSRRSRTTCALWATSPPRNASGALTPGPAAPGCPARAGRSASSPGCSARTRPASPTPSPWRSVARRYRHQRHSPRPAP